MADRIQLLPDNIANQIAAGEVIQRPASAVKELLENAVDAGATEIKLFINDAGKALIQVIDNGGGMSETDARMCFERHATSKIRNIDDLFHIRTMGFRGEALASIAAVAQVELKTRRKVDEVGTHIDIENSYVSNQQPAAAAVGTSISMKNLFYNVPARRNFLKSNAAELRHIVDEFIRVALAFPQIFFSLTSNGQQTFYLESGTLKQRIAQLLGNQYTSKLVSVKEETDYLNIYGFVGKPDTAKKTRGDQYLFVNSRFIKSAYLNHAIMGAFQDLIPSDSFPMYVLFIDLDPMQVDVNVHPTKQEIKFEDEKIVYAFVQAAVKHALAQFSITPTLDFELDRSIQQLDSIQQPFTEERKAAAASSHLYRTFTEANQSHFIESRSEASPSNFRNPQPSHEPGFQSLSKYFTSNDSLPEPSISQSTIVPSDESQLRFTDSKPVQLFNTYVLIQGLQGFYLIHQQVAHERVIYERLLQAVHGKPIAVQHSLFPSTLELTPGDCIILNEILPDLSRLGYLIEPFGKTAFVIHGTPADVGNAGEKKMIEKIIEEFKHFNHDLKLSLRERLLRSVAINQSVKAGAILSETEMNELIAQLFQCRQPNVSPSGKPVFIEFRREQVERMFGR